MGINSGLCSLDNHFSSLPKSISKKHKKSYEYFSELLSVESINLVVSWDKFMITLYQLTCGDKYFLRKAINFVPPSYRTIFCLCVRFVLSLLLCVIFPTWTSLSRVRPHVFDLVDSSECCAHTSIGCFCFHWCCHFVICYFRFWGFCFNYFKLCKADMTVQVVLLCGIKQIFFLAETILTLYFFFFWYRHCT